MPSDTGKAIEKTANKAAKIGRFMRRTLGRRSIN
jgi:hypothetical protein